MSSFWLDEPAGALPARRRRAAAVDVTVIGGGVTGCACARALAAAGVAVEVREAREIGSGASGRNGGFALRGAVAPYDIARNELGRETASRLWRLTERYLDRMEELAGDAFRRTGSLRLAADADEGAELQAEYEALSEDGFEVEWVDELPAPLSSRFVAAIHQGRDGAMHPARWARRLAGLAAAAGAMLVEHSRVESLDELASPIVVIATDGYTNGLLPELDAAIRPVRGQVVATEPLAEQRFGCPHYARRGFDYWQQLPDGRLIAGGRRDHDLEREFTGDEALTPVVQTQIESLLVELLGELPPITHRWSGIFGLTEDRRPLVGPVPGRDGLWVACGYSGHGNVMALASGELVAQAILGEPADELALFDPSRVLGL